MSEPYFKFKQFTVFHDRCGMKVSTDGVLLGAWVNVEGARSILDAGTGTGLLALMVAQRCTAMIDAVEIDENACGQARENVAICPWKDRIMIHHDSFQHFARKTENRYDLIVSNPPWYRNSLKPPALSRSVARHDQRLGFEALLHGGDKLLSAPGRLGLILPATEIERFTELAYFHNLHLLRQTLVHPAADKDHSRCLAEFGRFRPSSVEMNELVIRQGKEYSDGYIELTKEYYLLIYQFANLPIC
jgi:tRNA1Val (adenine37-N6)-methyltransferase